jgi:hypothetical protein
MFFNVQCKWLFSPKSLETMVDEQIDRLDKKVALINKTRSPSGKNKLIAEVHFMEQVLLFCCAKEEQQNMTSAIDKILRIGIPKKLDEGVSFSVQKNAQLGTTAYVSSFLGEFENRLNNNLRLDQLYSVLCDLENRLMDGEKPRHEDIAILISQTWASNRLSAVVTTVIDTLIKKYIGERIRYVKQWKASQDWSRLDPMVKAEWKWWGIPQNRAEKMFIEFDLYKKCFEKIKILVIKTGLDLFKEPAAKLGNELHILSTQFQMYGTVLMNSQKASPLAKDAYQCLQISIFKSHDDIKGLDDQICSLKLDIASKEVEPESTAAKKTFTVFRVPTSKSVTRTSAESSQESLSPEQRVQAIMDACTISDEVQLTAEQFLERTDKLCWLIFNVESGASIDGEIFIEKLLNYAVFMIGLSDENAIINVKCKLRAVCGYLAKIGCITETQCKKFLDNCEVEVLLPKSNISKQQENNIEVAYSVSLLPCNPRMGQETPRREDCYDKLFDLKQQYIKFIVGNCFGQSDFIEKKIKQLNDSKKVLPSQMKQKVNSYIDQIVAILQNLINPGTYQ